MSDVTSTYGFGVGGKFGTPGVVGAAYEVTNTTVLSAITNRPVVVTEVVTEYAFDPFEVQNVSDYDPSTGLTIGYTAVGFGGILGAGEGVEGFSGVGLTKDGRVAALLNASGTLGGPIAPTLSAGVEVDGSDLAGGVKGILAGPTMSPEAVAASSGAVQAALAMQPKAIPAAPVTTEPYPTPLDMRNLPNPPSLTTEPYTAILNLRAPPVIEPGLFNAGCLA